MKCFLYSYPALVDLLSIVHQIYLIRKNANGVTKSFFNITTFSGTLENLMLIVSRYIFSYLKYNASRLRFKNFSETCPIFQLTKPSKYKSLLPNSETSSHRSSLQRCNFLSLGIFNCT